ncbi:MAG: O-linked N-acetylglucosamine transferase, SPINDLY family protein, partial [Rhodospirillaceae bacterium]
PDQQPYYTEKLWALPECYLPSDRRRAPVESVHTRAACGLPGEGFIFCSFNNSYKITPQIFDIWMNLLRGVPGSVLWLVRDNADVSKNLRREAAARGIDGDRLFFAPKLPSMAAHLSRYRLADLFLDTFPYNAATTASDALWAGLPVLTLSGKTYASRMAGSILRAVGLDELVTTSAADYEARARMLATQPDRLGGVRALLAKNKGTSPLFDSDRHRRHLEAAFEAMIENRRAIAQKE